MPTFRYVLADVFTDTPLEGNGLAVFTDARELPEETLQPLARELNLSETVYVYPAEAGGHARIRIFTPMDELPFAGHPVLGTAFVLAAPLQLPEIVLETGKGPIPVRLEREEDRISFGWMSSRFRRSSRSRPPTSFWLPSASRAPSSPSRSTTTARATSTSRSRASRPSRRSSRTSRP